MVWAWRSMLGMYWLCLCIQIKSQLATVQFVWPQADPTQHNSLCLSNNLPIKLLGLTLHSKFFLLHHCCLDLMTHKLIAPDLGPDFTFFWSFSPVLALTVSRLSRSVLASMLGGVVWMSASSWRIAYSCWVLVRLTRVFSLSTQSGSATCTAMRSFRCTPRIGNLKPKHSEKRLRYWL